MKGRVIWFRGEEVTLDGTYTDIYGTTFYNGTHSTEQWDEEKEEFVTSVANVVISKEYISKVSR